MHEIKTDRVLELFFRALKGEELSAQKLAQEAGVTTRSISRDLTRLKLFLAEHRELLGHAELVYSGSTHCYHLEMDNFITNKELLAVTKALIGCRALSRQELLTLIAKLKLHTSYEDRKRLENLIRRELYHYREINFDCSSVVDNLWRLSEFIENSQLITITYNRMDRVQVKHRLKPVSLMFTEYYYYLIAYAADAAKTYAPDTPYYFRVDRIVGMQAHREHFRLTASQNVDEGILRQRSQFMWPGRLRRITFEFNGPSLQAVLDRLPTARVVSSEGNTYILEAEVYGDGIKMFLLSQGSWVRVTAPQEFVDEMRAEAKKIVQKYE